VGYRLEKVSCSAQSTSKCGATKIFLWGQVDLVDFIFDHIFYFTSVLVVIVPHTFILLCKHVKYKIAVASIDFANVSIKPI